MNGNNQMPRFSRGSTPPYVPPAWPTGGLNFWINNLATDQTQDGSPEFPYHSLDDAIGYRAYGSPPSTFYLVPNGPDNPYHSTAQAEMSRICLIGAGATGDTYLSGLVGGGFDLELRYLTMTTGWFFCKSMVVRSCIMNDISMQTHLNIDLHDTEVHCAGKDWQGTNDAEPYSQLVCDSYSSYWTRASAVDTAPTLIYYDRLDIV